MMQAEHKNEQISPSGSAYCNSWTHHRLEDLDAWSPSSRNPNLTPRLLENLLDLHGHLDLRDHQNREWLPPPPEQGKGWLGEFH